MSLASAVWCNFNGNLVIKAFDENFRPRNIIPKIRPYFFVKSADLERCRETLKSSGKVSSIERGDFYTFDARQPCVKVECFWPYDVKDLRQALEASGIQTYEADISFVRRWMIDENIYPSQNAAVLFWDMECDCREGLAFADKPSARILSFAAVDHSGKEFFICDNDEEEMVNQFFRLIQNYPVLVGWNNLNWDLPYLIARSKVLGFNYPFKYHQHMDMMILYDKSDYGSYSSLKLDDVAHKELNAGKTFSIDGIGGAEALWKMFLNDKDRLKEYNLQDARLVQMLESKLNLLKIQFNISSFAGVLLSDTNYVSRIIDTMIFRRLAKEPVRLVLRNRQFNSEKISFPGGYVHQPDRALHKWVFEYDFKSLYPSIIITFNVGLDTKDEYGDILTEKARFTSEREAMVVKLLRELQRQRNLAKKERDKYPMGSPQWNEYHALQITYKLISNSFWGALGESAGRMFDLDLAESITLTGQAIIKETMKIMDQLGAKSLYADSVTGETLIPIIKNGIIYKATIEELFENYAGKAEKIGEKEYIDLSEENLETFAIDDNGELHVDKIKKVIRHKTDKKIFTVNTPFGSVRVTEDHSLIVKDSGRCYPCQAKDLNVDAKLIYLNIDYGSMHNLRKGNKRLFSPPNKKQVGTYGEFRYFGETTVLSVKPEGSSTQYVYDLEVDRHHTFLANKIFVHNTDSCFVAAPKELAGCSGEILTQKAKILEKIANSMLAERLIKKYNIPKERYSIVLEFQNLFYKVFFTGKKKQYIGQVYSREKTATLRDMSTSDFGINTDISLVGLSMKKYNTCRFLKIAQKRILDNILASDSLEDARDKVRNVCLNIKKLLYSHALDDCLVQRTGVRKDLSAYKVNSIQCVLGKQLQACGLFRRGDVLDYVIVDVKDGKLIPKVLTNKNEKIHPTREGLKYYENLLSNMIERLLGEKINLENCELDKWL